MNIRTDREWIYEAPLLNLEGLSRDIGNLLVLAPHPDDESLGCGGLIAHLRASDANVHVIIVTDGSASHPNSMRFPPSRLAQIREDEVIRACGHLGIDEKQITFLNQQDSELESLCAGKIHELASLIAKKFELGNFDSLALPWRRDPHADHRVVYRIGQDALNLIENGVTQIEYPIWLWQNGTDDDWPREDEITPYILDISTVANKKSAAIHEHLSQLGKIVDDDQEGFVLTEDLLQPFLKHKEYFFLTNKRPLEKLNCEYFENLYAQNSDPWDFKTSEYEHKKYALSIEVLKGSKFERGLELGCSIGVQTKLLAKICKKLVAVDVSMSALDVAKKNCTDLNNVHFELADIAETFPIGKFDLITLCELGYYFDETILYEIYKTVNDRLLVGGKLLMVHWTPYVATYPLTGNKVHEVFERFAIETGNFEERIKGTQELFRIQVWQKSTEGLPK